MAHLFSNDKIREIVWSQIFKVHYGGNCFTCHNVNGAGEFEVLGEALVTNDKGVPNPDG